MKELQFKTMIKELSVELDIEIFAFDRFGHCINTNKCIDVNPAEKVEIIKNEVYLYQGYWFSFITTALSDWYVSISNSNLGAEKIIKLIKFTLEREIKRNHFTHNGLRMLLFDKIPEDRREYMISALNISETKEYRMVVVKYDEEKLRFAMETSRKFFINSEVVTLDGDLIAIFILEKEGIDDIIKEFVSALKEDDDISIRVGIGISSKGSDGIYESFKTALSALLVGRSLLKTQNVYKFEDLVLPLLVYEANNTIIRKYLSNSDDGMIEIFTEPELLESGRQFLLNNLNTSETSSSMFIHRNTLIYRLEKIKKVTGLDIRKFEDALKFYIRYIAWQLQN